MNRSQLEATLEELGIPALIDRAGQVSIGRSLASQVNSDIEENSPERLARLGFTYEAQGITAYQQQITKRGMDKGTKSEECFKRAFVCWVSLAYLDVDEVQNRKPRISPRAVELLNREFGEEPCPTVLTFAFRLAVAGLHAQRPAETRFELNKFDLDSLTDQADWKSLVTHKVFSSFVRLVRKAGGWTDIDEALTDIEALRQLQQQQEEGYLNSFSEGPLQTGAGIELVGLYHLAQMVTLTGQYLRDGEE